MTPDEMPTWAVRLEGKVDAVLGIHETRLTAHDEKHEDHEARLRSLEGRSTVAPWQLWTAVLGAMGLVGVVLQIIDHLPTAGG